MDVTEQFRFVVYTVQWVLHCGVRWTARFIGDRGMPTNILELTGENVFVVLADEVYEDSKMQELKEVLPVKRLSDGSRPRIASQMMSNTRICAHCSQSDFTDRLKRESRSLTDNVLQDSDL
jgi:hypothetical protein